MVRLSCPSCNTSFTLPELPADRRATCPRCGDVFPVRSFTVGPAVPAEPQTQTAGAAGPTRRDRARWSVQRAVAVALAMGLVGLLAGVGVYYARGGFRSNPAQEPELTPADVPTPATQLVGLGYLPADTGIAFALQPGPAIAYARRTNQDPRELITKAGIPRQMLEAIDQLGV